MGYSCSARAGFTLDAIKSLSEFDIDSADYKYFCEIGGENQDGSITGTVYELIGQGYRDEQGFKRRPCKKKGSFKIDSYGNVVRFPGVSKRMFGVVEIVAIEKYDREFPMFRVI